ncbi:acetylcholine receptor subunit alpha-1-B [Aplysia californica]|uniref:Acetylcholine receptor subunit alpha-1-B n=1 Tax=Aplysia californica TaxID=6500 RepID=A0ABM1VSQ8_APLCA|nr:acetylcholine receptor subunit alpha-1-B [Aplysia californica]
MLKEQTTREHPPTTLGGRIKGHSIDHLGAIDEDSIPMRVTYTGTVKWHPPGVLVVSCDMDTTYFPFDRQICSIELTSFGYTVLEVNPLSSRGMLTDYFQKSGDWSLGQLSTTTSTYEDNGLDYGKNKNQQAVILVTHEGMRLTHGRRPILKYSFKSFSSNENTNPVHLVSAFQITYEVVMVRRSDFYWLNVVFPVIVNGILTIFLFLLPAESGERIGYSLTVLLAFVVLMTLLAADMPTSAKHTSLLGETHAFIVRQSHLQ